MSVQCTLFCETWNAHCAHATVVLLEKETPEFIPPQLWLLNSPDLNPVDNSMWENVARECVQNTHHCSWAVNDATDELLLQWRHSPAFVLIGPLCSQSLFQFVEISDACFVHQNHFHQNRPSFKEDITKTTLIYLKKQFVHLLLQ